MQRPVRGAHDAAPAALLPGAVSYWMKSRWNAVRVGLPWMRQCSSLPLVDTILPHGENVTVLSPPAHDIPCSLPIAALPLPEIAEVQEKPVTRGTAMDAPV